MTHISSYDDYGDRISDPEVCSESVVPQHPMGIKPTGNQFVAGNNIKAAAGMFSYLPDELLIQLLESLEPLPLLQLGATCKALYAFSRFEDIWRTQFLKYAVFSQDSVSRFKVTQPWAEHIIIT